MEFRRVCVPLISEHGSTEDSVVTNGSYVAHRHLCGSHKAGAFLCIVYCRSLHSLYMVQRVQIKGTSCIFSWVFTKSVEILMTFTAVFLNHQLNSSLLLNFVNTAVMKKMQKILAKHCRLVWKHRLNSMCFQTWVLQHHCYVISAHLGAYQTQDMHILICNKASLKKINFEVFGVDLNDGI